jgi:hypothetical protein
MESSRRLKANMKIAGTACGWCQSPINAGDDAAVCTACEAAVHAACWDGKQGCASAGCANAPLQQLEPSTAPANRGNVDHCAHCGAPNATASVFCSTCGQSIAGGASQFVKINAPGAVTSLVCGIIGLFFCGVIFGLIAVTNASKAKQAITAEPGRYTGSGLATAGQVLGILGIIGWAIILIVRLGNM